MKKLLKNFKGPKDVLLLVNTLGLLLAIAAIRTMTWQLRETRNLAEFNQTQLLQALNIQVKLAKNAAYFTRSQEALDFLIVHDLYLIDKKIHFIHPKVKGI